MDKKKKSNARNVLIGGAWPYANSSLHLGHLAALIAGDFLKRYHQLIGDNVLYVSGTDCHGTPITERAKREKIHPSEIAEKYHKEFKEVFAKMKFSYDIYSKTTDEYHKRHVQDMFLRLYENGSIYAKKEPQPFCQHCNRFEADRELQLICPSCGVLTKGDQCDCGYIPEGKDLVGATCRDCGNPTIQKENTHLYIALSKLQKQIEGYVEKKGKNWRIASVKETEKYLKEGLRDRVATRDLPWGIDIPIPGFEDKKMYVWIEAVMGYITATQKICEERGLNWEDYWKDNKDKDGKDDNILMYMCHGKDNIPFHTMILPALLIALDDNYHLPDIMVATQYVNINSEKISKSKGNGITVLQMMEDFEIDPIRYYMISRGPENADIDFTLENYVNVHNADLVNKFGNFVNRTLKFKGLTTVPLAKMDKEMEDKIEETYKEVTKHIEALEYRKACSKIIWLIEAGNKYYDDRKPWIQKKEDVQGFNDTIYTCANIIANLSNLLEPIMPDTSAKLRKYLKIDKPSWEKIQLTGEIPLENIGILFERISLNN